MARPHPFVAVVRGTVLRHRLLAPGDRVLLAVSGGPDSMALLHALAALAPGLRLRLSVATVDHGLRDAAAEHALVADAATALGLPWQLLPVRVARADGSLMQGARDARSAALVGASSGARIATGHTASDQAETVLLRMLRGAGTRGVSGILPSRGPWIRPLLDCTRDDVVAWLRDAGVPWAEDPTNDSPAHARNRVRHELLPVLRALSPEVERHLVTLADNARSDRLALESLAEDALRAATVESAPGLLALDLARLAVHRGLLPHVLRRAVERVRRRDGDLWRPHMDALVALASGRAGTTILELPGATATRVYGTLRVTRGHGAPETTSIEGKEIVGPGCYRLGPMLLTVERQPATGRIERGPDSATFDAESLRFPLRVRPWRHGDRVIPFGMVGHRKVSDVLTDARVPRQARPAVQVLEGEDGLLWIIGVRRAAAHPVTPSTREVFHVRVRREVGAVAN
ncbi:MAG: tRNA(Ile)-lysidine synthase [Myxococcales bacterium]